MPKQFIARCMPARVIDQLELIQVEKHQGMAARLACQIVQGLFEPIFEFATIGQARQSIVSRLP